MTCSERDRLGSPATGGAGLPAPAEEDVVRRLLFRPGRTAAGGRLPAAESTRPRRAPALLQSRETRRQVSSSASLPRWTSTSSPAPSAETSAPPGQTERLRPPSRWPSGASARGETQRARNQQSRGRTPNDWS